MKIKIHVIIQVTISRKTTKLYRSIIEKLLAILKISPTNKLKWKLKLGFIKKRILLAIHRATPNIFLIMALILVLNQIISQL